MFDWQLPNPGESAWHHYSYDENRWWGAFPDQPDETKDLFGENPWALGPFPSTQRTQSCPHTREHGIRAA
jgi:hypothetical protein